MTSQSKWCGGNPDFRVSRIDEKVIQTSGETWRPMNSRMKHLFLRAIFPILLLCQMAAAQQNVRTIFLVRHAEKVSTAADAPLSPEGQKRAECLASTLKDTGIKQIYVTDVLRTQQTVAPLAKALKIKPTILPAKDTNALIKNLVYTGGGNILVVGHSDTIPFVIARLQGGTVAPIGENEYDRLFVMTIVEAAGMPAATLHYCSAGTSLKATPTPEHPAKKKAPAKKMY
jgi:phosphohistidine phosphatase SixA